jgi:hypothetical protein
MPCTKELWRFGRAQGTWWRLERWGALAVLLVWLLYVFIAKDFAGYANNGQLQLIDLLLGVPILVALGLVGSIIWMGVVRLFSCALGKLALEPSPQMNDEA